MRKPSEEDLDALRMKIMGLGERSYRKSYYPELQEKIAELERFRSLLDQANDIIFLLQLPGGRITYSSLSGSKQLGYSTSELVRMSIFDLLPSSASGTLLKLMEEADSIPDRQGILTTILLDKEGSEIPVEMTICLVTSEGLPSAILVVRDITERKRAEDALQQSHDELERRVEERTSELVRANEEQSVYAKKLESLNQELQQFSFIASHDLKEPLRKIQFFGNVLTRKYDAEIGEEGRDYLLRMTNAADRMSSLLEALLTYSQVATRANPFSPTDLTRVIRDVLSDLELAIERESAQVEADALLTIEADPAQMRQLFQNLISNALKYRRKEVPLTIHVRGESDENSCRVFVKDNGIGFDEIYLDRIFLPFQRLHGRDEYEGTGMGLAICRKIVERHSGSITATSEPGKGSTFIVTLPKRQIL